MLSSLKKGICAINEYMYNLSVNVITCLRTVRYKLQGLKLKNKTPSIISSNCIGGVLLHNYNLRFNTPTINLYIKNDDYFYFVENLSDFLNADLTEVADSGESYPVGRLIYNDKKVDIYFQHYKSFEEATKKWNERKSRVDFSNIFIIHMIVSVNETDVERFEALPYKNKMLIANANPTNSKYVVVNKVFSRKDYVAGMILNFKSKCSLKRYMDDIDFIRFLNSK